MRILKDLDLKQITVNELFEYKDGFLYWKINIGKKKIKGKLAGCIKGGYRSVGFNGRQYMEHRIIFLMHHGYMPNMIDHVNRNGIDNHIENIRECTIQQNMWNKSKQKNKTSIYNGVCFNKASKKFFSSIRLNNKSKFLGSFKNESDAAICYNKHAVLNFGEFANLNIVQI